MRCVCGHGPEVHARGVSDGSRRCQGLDRGLGHLSALCGCQRYTLPWWARVSHAVGWFLFDLVTRSVAALLAFVALILLACAAWLVTHGVRVLPVALVTLLACAGCGNEGEGVPSSSCATCDGGGVNAANSKVVALCVGLAACSSSDARVMFRGPSPQSVRVVDSGVPVADALSVVPDVLPVVDVRTVIPDVVSAPDARPLPVCVGDPARPTEPKSGASLAVLVLDNKTALCMYESAKCGPFRYFRYQGSNGNYPDWKCDPSAAVPQLPSVVPCVLDTGEVLVASCSSDGGAL